MSKDPAKSHTKGNADQSPTAHGQDPASTRRIGLKAWLNRGPLRPRFKKWLADWKGAAEAVAAIALVAIALFDYAAFNQASRQQQQIAEMQNYLTEREALPMLSVAVNDPALEGVFGRPITITVENVGAPAKNLGASYYALLSAELERSDEATQDCLVQLANYETQTIRKRAGQGVVRQWRISRNPFRALGRLMDGARAAYRRAGTKTHVDLLQYIRLTYEDRLNRRHEELVVIDGPYGVRPWTASAAELQAFDRTVEGTQAATAVFAVNLPVLFLQPHGNPKDLVAALRSSLGSPPLPRAFPQPSVRTNPSVGFRPPTFH